MGFIRLIFSVFIILCYLRLAISELYINVSQQHCGLTVDLAVERRLVLEYNGSDIGDCEITASNTVKEKMMCIELDRTRTLGCFYIFEYFIRQTRYSCFDLYTPLCTEESQVSAKFTNWIHPDILQTSVHVEIYVTPVTTTSVAPTWTTYGGSYDHSSDGSQTGTIIGITSGAVVVFVLCICVVAARRMRKEPDTSGTPNMIYQQGVQHTQPQGIQYQQAVQYIQPQGMSAPPPRYDQVVTGSPEQNRGTALEGYHVHPRVTLKINDQNTTTEQSASGLVDPSAPPPPYPGT